MSIISIEGNIGSGKSTLLHLLSKYNNFITLKEPVDEWLELKNSKNVNILQLFYANKERWSYTFQMNAFISRFKLLEKTIVNNPNKLILTERTVQTDRNCFALELKEQGCIDDLEWKLYIEWYEWLVEKKNSINPIAIIYINVDPEICMKRIVKRSRLEESNISLDYLKKIHEKHENWINNMNTPKLILDFSGNINDTLYIDNIMNQIRNFLNLLPKNK